MDSVLQDIRYAVRMLGKDRGFALTAIATLALCLGANAAVFAVVNAVLLRPLAYQDPDDVFVAREIDPQLFGQRFLGVNPTHAREWAIQCPSLKDVALIRGETAQLTGAGEPASLRGARITHNLLALLGVEPVRGRPFRADEEQAGNHQVVMLSETFWRSRFNADPSLVGRTIVLDGDTHQVVGIVPASFRIPSSGASNRRDDVFRPLVLPADEIGRLMGNYNYFALLRVKPGASAGHQPARR